MDNNIDPYAALHILQHHARAGEPCKICGQPIHDPKNSNWIDTEKDWVCKSCIEKEINLLKDKIENAAKTIEKLSKIS